MRNNSYKKTRKALAIILALSAMTAGLASCNKTEVDTPDTPDVGIIDNSGAKDEIELPENENKKEEIIINENYADSELFEFEGTIDEIYEDGSMLIYSPFFGVNFDYKVIVEADANTKALDFEPKINQQVKFNVYSAVKKSEPLTVVASDMSLVKEVSTQRAEEEARKQKVQENLDKFLKGQK